MRSRLILAATVALAAPARGDDGVDYLKGVKPVLQARCYACHGALKQKGGLRLDTAAAAIRGGTGPAIVPGDVDASPLIDRITADENDPDRMPPEGERLKAAEVEAIRSWIAQGAKAPADERPERDPRDHWAFRAPVRPIVPMVENGEWVANPIDAFILAKLEAKGLTPQPPADRRVWLRRVTLDLVGLPPSRGEIEAFVADEAPDAERRVVDRLLASPRYGERWGRQWLDIWRYSDWWGLGEEVRNSQKHIWHWRDWVVESLNDDTGYDQMLREMLAADELYPDDLGRLRATGFLARQYFKFNRTTWLDETIEHTSKAMLGLTIHCAKCHDHKYDPIAQVDYYRFRAIFEPYQVRTDMVPGEADVEKDGIPRAFDCNLSAPTYLHVRGDDRRPDTTKPLAPGVPAFLASPSFAVEPVTLPAEASEPSLRPFVLDSHLKAADRRIAEACRAVEASCRALAQAGSAAKRKAGAPDPIERATLALLVARKSLATAEAQPDSIRARAAAERARHEAPSSERFHALAAEAACLEKIAAVAKAEEDVARAELALFEAKPETKKDLDRKLWAAKKSLEATQKAASAPGEAYTRLAGARKTLESNLETEESRNKPFPDTSTGRRAALARWITDPGNPLPARVAVNHVWARHFGRPLMPTVFDFGRKGAPPTHPELLDWLAVEFVEHGWSLKHLHRLIVTSNTYRLTSSSLGAPARNLAEDPDNALHWRANPIRMESEVIRDSLLKTSGDLDTRLGGPPVPVSNAASRRRSLYFVHSHNEHQAFLATFDDASVLECYRRAESIVPQQALALENSPLARSAAEAIARRLAGEAHVSTDREFVRAAFLAVLAVEPSDEERAVAEAALDRFRAAARRAGRKDPDVRARINLIHALLNHNDFVTIR